MIWRHLPVALSIVLLAACTGGGEAPSGAAETGDPASGATTVVGAVGDVAPSARMIVLAEPVDGFIVVVLDADGEVLAADGGEIGLQDLVRGQPIAATGRRGTSDGLIASVVKVVEEGAGVVEEGAGVAPDEDSSASPTDAATAGVPLEIRLDTPEPGRAVSSPLEVRGWVSAVPDDGALRIRVFNGQGQQIGEMAVTVTGEVGQPGTFAGHVVFDAPEDGGGTVQVADVSHTDGSTAASVQVQVSFGGKPSISITGVVTALFPNPPLITLEEPVRGLGFIALTEDTELAFLNGGDATLQDIQPGVPVYASGFREGEDTLVATKIVLIEEGAPPAPEPSNVIELEAPQNGETVSSPIGLRGRVSATPFEGTLVIRVIGPEGDLLAEVPIIVDGEMGEPAEFAAEVEYNASQDGLGRIDVVEISAEDGSVVASASVEVVFSGAQDFMIVGRVSSVFASARIIDLGETVEGYDLIALVDDTKILSVDGAEIALEEIEPGMKIEATGQPGISGTLVATLIRVLP